MGLLYITCLTYQFCCLRTYISCLTLPICCLNIPIVPQFNNAFMSYSYISCSTLLICCLAAYICCFYKKYRGCEKINIRNCSNLSFCCLPAYISCLILSIRCLKYFNSWSFIRIHLWSYSYITFLILSIGCLIVYIIYEFRGNFKTSINNFTMRCNWALGNK